MVMEQLAALMSYKLVAVLAWLALLLVLERMFPLARVVGGVKRVAKNLSLAGLNALISPLIVVPVSVFAVTHALGWRPLWWSGWPGLFLDLLALDFWIYWWHRANHRWPLLWRFHEVHHLDEFLDASSALRFHFGEVVLSALARAAVILLLGVPLVSVVVFETLLAFNTMFHHSDLRLPPKLEKALSWVIVTPSIHWVHHHAIRQDTDSNYASLLSVWDRLFGSRSHTVRTAEMPIGTEGLQDRGLPGLLARPFEER
jgi:sterol desaturase/sphingolipid hydroxylase (fatty acid hydroxylase superfamily)